MDLPEAFCSRGLPDHATYRTASWRARLAGAVGHPPCDSRLEICIFFFFYCIVLYCTVHRDSL